MATVSRTYVFAANAEGFTDQGNAAGITMAWTASDGNPAGALEWTGSLSGTEFARDALEAWTTKFPGIPAGAIITQVQVTGWDELAWGGGTQTRQIRFRIVDSTNTTVHSAGDLFDTGSGSPTNVTGTVVAKGAGTARAVDAAFQAAATQVKFEIQMDWPGAGIRDLEQDNIAVTVTYTTGGLVPPLDGQIFWLDLGPSDMFGPDPFDEVFPAFPSTTQLILMTLTANATAAVLLQNQVNKALSASGPASALLTKLVLKPLTANSTSTTNLQKTVFKALTANSTSTTSLTRTVLKLLLANSASSTSLQKTVLKLLVANSSATASLSALKVVVMVLVANATAAASLVKLVTKPFTANSTSATSLTKKINKTLLTNATASASLLMQKVIVMVLVANATATAFLQKQTSKALVAAAPTATTLTKLIKKAPFVALSTASATVNVVLHGAVTAIARGRNIVFKRFGIY